MVSNDWPGPTSGEIAHPKRGRLTLFLGYAPGVGKTRAMLGAARRRAAAGEDVVVTGLRTQGGMEETGLLEGLEVFVGQGSDSQEMGLDALLARRPALAVVDDLAHINAPESRHPRRYHDVDELLEAGIDVYTTINIQQFQSLNDVARQITGTPAPNLVPDRLLDEAAELELVDLPPDELIGRVESGLVQTPDVGEGARRFFRRGNLIALRQMALRRAAEWMDRQMQAYMTAKEIAGPWPARDRILVCVSSHPLSENLVRAGRRLAGDLKANWTVVFVETPGHARMKPQQRERLNRTLALAEQMGADMVRLTGYSAAETILEYCQSHNVNKILLGRPRLPVWNRLLRESVTDQILRKGGRYEVTIVGDSDEDTPPGIPGLRFTSPLWKYGLSVLLVGAAGLASLPFTNRIEPSNLVMLFLAAVVLAAVFLGRGPSILASLLGVLMFDYFFVDPRLSFSVHDTQYLLTFFGLMAVGLVISHSAALLRDQVEILQRREAHTAALNSLSRELTGAYSLDDMLNAVILHVSRAFNRGVIVLLPEGERLAAAAATPGFDMDEADRQAAAWAFQHQQPAGRGTETMPICSARYLPLRTAAGMVGVLGIRPELTQVLLSPEQRELLDGFASLAALAIERARLADQANQAEILKTTDRLQAALLNSISHELRTPLAVITGALSTLGEAETEDEVLMGEAQDARRELVDTAYGEAQRLNLLVGNLLDMTRLEAGAFHLSVQPCDLTDLVGVALSHIPEGRAGHPIQVGLPDNLPFIPVDMALMAQVLVNLLDNAAKYSPASAPIELSAEAAGEEMIITVADRGMGIAAQDLERIFDKFYRSPEAHGPGGTGLGLSICKGIVEAHGGRIWAENRPGGGALLRVALRLERQAHPGQEEGR